MQSLDRQTDRQYSLQKLSWSLAVKPPQARVTPCRLLVCRVPTTSTFSWTRNEDRLLALPPDFLQLQSSSPINARSLNF